MKKFALLLSFLLNLIIIVHLLGGYFSVKQSRPDGYEAIKRNEHEIHISDEKKSDRLLGSQRKLQSTDPSHHERELQKIAVPASLISPIYKGTAILPNFTLSQNVAEALRMTPLEKERSQKLISTACENSFSIEQKRAIEDPEKANEPGIHLLLDPDLSGLDAMFSQLEEEFADTLGEERSELMIDLLKKEERFRPEEKTLHIEWQPKSGATEAETGKVEEWEFRVTGFDIAGKMYEYGLSSKPFGRYAHLILEKR